MNKYHCLFFAVFTAGVGILGMVMLALGAINWSETGEFDLLLSGAFFTLVGLHVSGIFAEQAFPSGRKNKEDGS